MKTTRIIKSSLLLAAGLFLPTAASQAALSYHITISTSSLVGNPGAPFSLDFQLNSGDTLGNNTALISNFTFNGGGASGSANAFGGSSGDIGSSVNITDTAAFNELFQTFTAGSAIEFDLFLSQNVDAGPTPDVFTISLLDSSLSNIATNSADGANTLLHLDINSPTAGNTVGELNLASGTLGYSATALAIPEPSAALLGLVAFGFGVLRRRRSA